MVIHHKTEKNKNNLTLHTNTEDTIMIQRKYFTYKYRIMLKYNLKNIALILCFSLLNFYVNRVHQIAAAKQVN